MNDDLEIIENPNSLNFSQQPAHTIGVDPDQNKHVEILFKVP